MTVRTLIVLPKGKATVRLESDAPIEATLAFDPPRPNADGGIGGRHRADWELDSTGDPVELVATIPTAMNGKPAILQASYRMSTDPADRPIPAGRQILPWAPPSTPISAAAPPIPFSTAGGDPLRGETIFNGAEAKCLACHRIRGKGGETGPALDDLAGRDLASVYRDIAAPSTLIDPEYLPYTVALKDGRVASGVVRAEGADAIRVYDVNGQGTVIPRSEIEELRPAARRSCPSDWPVLWAKPGCATSWPS